MYIQYEHRGELTKRARQSNEHINVSATFQARRMLQTSLSGAVVIELFKTAQKHELTYPRTYSYIISDNSYIAWGII